MGMAGEEPDVDHRLRRRRLELRRADLPVPRPQVPRRGQLPDHRGRARGGAVADPRRLRLRLRRHRGRWRRSSRCTRSATTSSPSRSTPAACATTACRRSCRCSRSTATSRRGASTSGRRFEAGVQFARAEGILPAPEPTHAIRVAIDEALAAKEAGESRVILFNLCGHGHFDLSAYERYLAGTLEDYEYPAEKVEAALAAPADGLTRGGGPGRRRRAVPDRTMRTCRSSPAGRAAARSTRSRRSSRCSRRSGAARAAAPTSTPSAGSTSAGRRIRRQNPPDDPGPPAEPAATVAERRVERAPAARRRRRAGGSGMRVAFLGSG